MDVINGAQTLYSIPFLTRADMSEMCRGIFNEITKDGHSSMERPTIDGDMNNIAITIGRGALSKSVASATYCERWAKCGITFVPVCDGDRPVCKQATNERRATREKNRIKVFPLQKEIRQLQNKIDEGNHSLEEITEIKKEKVTKEKAFRAKISQCQELLPHDFAWTLEKELDETGLHETNRAGGLVTAVMRAKFQADALIGGRILKNETLMVVSKDSDIPIIVGDTCIAIKDYTINGKMTIVSTSRRTLENALFYLPPDARKRLDIKDAAHPIFESVSSRRVRALMAIILGCDVCLKGVPGVGPAMLQKQMSRFVKDGDDDEKRLDKLMGYMATITGKQREVIETYLKAIIYEPTNYATEMAGSVTHSYLGAEPTTLPSYLEEFASVSTSMIVGPEVLECKGICNKRHKFLAAEGHKQCHLCQDMVCLHWCDNINNNHYCLTCYAAESLVPNMESGIGEKVADMWVELTKKWNFDQVNELTVDEVEDAYSEQRVINARFHDYEQSVPFPIYSPSEMGSKCEMEKLIEINFRDGGTFISDPTIESHIPGVLDLFSTFAKFERKKQTDWIRDPSVYDVLPSTIIDFANKSRVDSGYRLCNRCVRHSLDPRTESMLCSTANLILVDGTIGIDMSSRVPASMKPEIYDTSVIVTANSIVCCECTCKSGAEENERVLCVHILPNLFKLTILLIDALAEHILLELASKALSLSERWSADTMASVKESVTILMEAAGEEITIEHKAKPLMDVLDGFVVGTERQKKWGQRILKPPKSEELGPISSVSFQSPAKKAKDIIERKIKSHIEYENPNQNPSSPPIYI